jgi:mannosyltransferase OCH1-like enzyme
MRLGYKLLVLLLVLSAGIFCVLFFHGVGFTITLSVKEKSANTEEIRNLVTHWDDKSEIPAEFKNSWGKMQRALPNLRPVLLDNDTCVHQVLNEAERRAFSSLAPQAYKSDLCRLVFLYNHGGLYVDIKFQPADFPLSKVIEENMLVSDIHHYVLNGFLTAKKGDPWIKKCIDKILENVATKNYAKDDLSVTGPGLLGDMAGPRERRRQKLVFEKHDTHNVVLEKKTRKVVAWYPRTYTGNSKFPRYGTLWNERRAFKEDQSQ